MTFFTSLWLVCGIVAAFLAHADLKRDIGRSQSVGPVWMIWAPFLGFLILFGPASLVAVYFIASKPEGE